MQTEYARKFVPAHADMGDWNQIKPLFDALDQRPIDTVKQLEQWLLECSELRACISEENSRRYVAMTCQTDDPAKEKAYLEFVEGITPKCKPRWHDINRKYVASPARKKLPASRYHVLDRSTTNVVELFRDENVPLQTQDSKLAQQYQKACGAMVVEYGGSEQTLQQMARYQREPDRSVRQEAWERVVARRLQDRAAINDIFDQMIELRTRIAENAGLSNFRDYQFKAYERFDYSPQDCLAFHEAIEKVVVPAHRALQQERCKTLKLRALRPWDLAVDPYNRPPLKPFQTAAELCDKCRQVFHEVDPALAAQFDVMVKAGWLDLESRKGKAPGGYQVTFEEARHPFIFMNAVGLHGDVETLLHEGGHAFHAIASRDEPLIQYRDCPIEMAEVASMGMELMAYDALDKFYQKEDLIRARREQLEGIIYIFPWIATIDAFQHWVYEHPDHSPQERTQQWLTLLDRFGGIEDWSGYDEARQAMWQRQLHLFAYPLYYIEYGIAQIGALQLWLNARADKAGALRKYREALALGGSRPLPELWAAAGLKFDFSEATLRPLIDAVLAELRLLESQ